MNASIFRSTSAPKRKLTNAKLVKIVAFVAILGALGGTVWWYFWGSKPRLALALSFPETAGAEVDCWRVGENGLVVLGGGNLSLVHLGERRQLWSVPLPVAVKIDYEWQASVAQRFLKLQQRAIELAAARANLKGEAAIISFNADAAKYAADLAAARADAARPIPQKAAVKTSGADSKSKAKAFALGDDRSQVDKFKAVQSEDELIRSARMAKRTGQISKLRASLNELRTKADTRLKLQQLKDEEAKLQALENEQKMDEAPTPQVAKAEPAEPELVDDDDDFGFSNGGKPHFASLGETFWFADGARLVGFDRSTGGVKATFNLPGPVLKMCAGPDAIVVAAHAGKKVRFLMKITADGNTQSNYMTVAGERPALVARETARIPVVDTLRSEFLGTMTPAIAEVKLVTKNIEVKSAIKPGAEAAAEVNVQAASGAGLGEALAILKVAENDKLRMDSGGEQKIDGSTYEVKVRTLFANPAVEWTGQFTGRVQFFSTPRFNLVTAGTKLVALNSANAKVWESSLAASALIADEHEWNVASSSPCFEDGDRLYFFDRAVLTAFNAANGEVLWRLPSVGISNVAIAADGFLYVHSANLSAESLTYLSEANAPAESILMKIKPSDGSIVWTTEKLESVWASGNDLYSMRVARPAVDIVKAAFKQEQASELRSKIYKINRRTGKMRWEWFQARAPLKVTAKGKTLAILFSDGLQVIHSTSL